MGKKKVPEETHESIRDKVGFFIRTGIVVLSFLVICAVGFKVLPMAISVTNSASTKKLPIYCVDEDEKKVALSFDAAWGNEDTADILKILEKHNVKVTFFMTGGWVEKFPEDVKAIAAAGHDLGNHSENHKHMSQLSKEQNIEEIMKVHKKVKDLTGVEMNLFRPPYGDYNNTVVDATKEAGYHCIQWDVDSLDWKDYGVDSIVKTVVNHKHLGNGSIILMHNGAKFTKDALESIITGLQEKGYEIVPISQLIHTGDYYMDHEGRQFEKK
ncbi:MAG: polysaccharide deacetylase [Lachnospiraceae bacterium]|jgi:polysaccharide deacetylase family sporulation protein PdaB|nr:polysaccharide deacetylase [Anaerocolumna sp.]MDF2610642.1 polysaccharide deacetylase [Lachnospiraceae bacterium]